MVTELIHTGFGNHLAINRVLAIVSPNSAPTKRLVQEARGRGEIIDMTSGRRTKAIIITDTGHVVLTAIAPETITSRVLASRMGGVKVGQSDESTQ